MGKVRVNMYKKPLVFSIFSKDVSILDIKTIKIMKREKKIIDFQSKSERL
jgi:hypothetical protein